MTTVIEITDEVDDEHFTVECKSGCVSVGGFGRAEVVTLYCAAREARDHAILTGHTATIRGGGA